MKTRIILIAGLLIALAACGDDSDPTGPAPVVTDQITVSLDNITIVKDCDSGSSNPGEFSYRFYVVLFENGTEIGREFDDAWNSFSANDNDSWDPGWTASFTLERRDDVQFNVRLAIREFDGTAEQFSQGTFIPHENDHGGPAWSPGPNGGVTEYTLYDSRKEFGIVDWDWRQNDECEGAFSYSVSVKRAGE